MKNNEKQFLAYVLVDPITNIPRYVGITTKTLKHRLAGHIRDINNRPDLNKHKTAWFKKLRKEGLIPRIELLKECTSLEELKQTEIDYIKKYRNEYNLINQTAGGDFLGFNSHSRESILKRKSTKAVDQYNVLGEFIASYDVTEDVVREYDYIKSASHITSCCKGKRDHAFGYIWRYRGEPLGDISHINPNSLSFNKIIQYDMNGKYINEFNSYGEASLSIGDKSKGANIASCCNGKQIYCLGYSFKLEPIYAYFDQSLYNNRVKKYNLYDYNKNPNLGYKIHKYTLDGKFLKSYSSYSEASMQEYKTINKRNRISKSCKNGTPYDNFIWKRVSINPSNSGDELTESIQS